MIKHIVDPTVIEMFLASEIKKLTDLVNVDARLNIQAPQIPLIASQLIELFPTESIEDFILCFKRGATGFYGQIFRLDAPVLIEWMRGTEDRGKRKGGYLDEKYSHVEAQRDKEKQKEQEENKIDYAAFIERRNKELNSPPPPPSNEKDNAYQRFKLEREQDPKVILQKKINDTASEFYQAKGGYNNIQTWTAENGFYVFAESEEDAKAIYLKATEE